MKAVHVSSTGQLEWKVTSEPKANDHEVVIDIHSAGVNRADLLQRAGNYPPPAGAPEFMGLECSGTIVEVGNGVSHDLIGTKVCALLPGGGYARKVAVDYRLTLPVPETISMTDAGGLAEAACTVWSNLIGMGSLKPKETVLIHGGTSGIGSFAVQFAKARGATIIATAGSAEKLATCKSLGADHVINYKTEDFPSRIAALTEGRGADVILDVRGGDYLQKNIDSLARQGRLLIIGTQGGRVGELSIGGLLSKAASVAAASLRNRPLKERIDIVAGVRRDVWPLIEQGHISVLVDSTFLMSDATAAHSRMESGNQAGKILLMRD